MSNGLSQAEIDALLSGAASAEPETPAEEPGSVPDVESVSALISDNEDIVGEAYEKISEDPETKGMYSTDAEFFVDDGSMPKTVETLEPYEIDAMGEVGNISMGTAATTLFALLNHKVSITTPSVTTTTMREIASKYPQPFVAVEVAYKRGLLGNNVLFLRESDVKIITDLLLGGDGTNIEGELSDLHLSAISEVMNQMMGSSATSLAKMINMPIDISPPTAYLVNLAEELPKGPLSADEPIVKNSFNMTVEGLLESEIMQIMPFGFCKALVKGLIDMQTSAPEPAPAPAAPPQAAPPAPAYAPPPAAPQQPAHAPPPQAAPAHAPAYAPPQQEQRYVDVKPAMLNAFEEEASQYFGNDNIDILMDVPLSVTVELGKSKKFIREILDFNVGSIIVLDKMAGEVVDVIVNGKLIAKGEVVVIDDNYGTRITDIVSPSKRLNKG